MKAALFRRGGHFEIAEVPTPQPGPGEVLVQVSYCGICGSDVHLVAAGMLPSGAIIGHELSGRVAKIGPGVAGFREGDPVVVMPLDPCLACGPCRQGNTQLCAEGTKRNYGLGLLPGAFAEFMLTKPSMLFPLPQGLDLKTAAINEPWAVAVHAVKMLALGPDSLLLVMGAGPIGLLVIYALKQAGVRRIYVSEPDPYRAQKAAQAGAARVINPQQQNPAVALPQNAGRAPDLVMDCVGSKNSTQDAAAIVGPKGTVLVLGVHLATISILPLISFGKEVTFKFSLGYRQDEFGESLQLLARGALDPQVVVSEIMPLSEIGNAFLKLRESGHTKILMDCRS